MNRQVIKNRIFRILTYLVTSLVFLTITAFLILQVPTVQQALVERYLRGLSEVTGFRTSVSSFQLLWFDRLEIGNLQVEDSENNRMISVQKLLVDFQLNQLFDNRDVHIDGVYIDSAEVYVTRITNSDTARGLNINVFINKINEHYARNRRTGRSPRINIGEALLNNSLFRYVDQDRDSIKTGFNYHQFAVDINEAQLQNFLALGDTIQFRVQTLLAKDRESPLEVNQLSTFFRISQQCLEFLDVSLHAGRSVISDTVRFTFNGKHELSDFNEKVNIHARFIDTRIYPEDLALFAPAARQLKQPFVLNGVMKGRVSNFKLTGMEIQTGNTVLRGSLDMDGLPVLSETFTILELNNSTVDFPDLAGIIGPQSLERLKPLGRVNMEGQFLGYFSDFVAHGNFTGTLGRLSTDINFKVNDQDINRSTYSGKLALSEFDLGTYMKDTINFGRVTMQGNIRGSGLTFQTAGFDLNGRIDRIDIRDYEYRNIQTNARFASQFFNGFLSIDDPNLKFTTEGSIDLRNNINEIRITSTIDTANFHLLNLTDRELFLRTDVKVNLKGLHLDSIIGGADIANLRVIHDGQELSLDSVRMTSRVDGATRNIDIESSVLDGNVYGDFLLTDLLRDVQTLVREISLNIRNDEKAIAEYYAHKSHRPKSYQTRFQFDVKNLEPVAQLFHTNLAVSPNTVVQGDFTSGYTTILRAFTNIDSLTFNNTLFVGTEVEVTTSKIADSTNVLAVAFVNSKSQQLTNKLHTRDLLAEAVWNENEVFFSLDADQKDQTNYVRLRGNLQFLRDSTQLHFLPSAIRILEQSWAFDPNNMITIRRDDVKIDQLLLRNNGQFVLLDGKLSRDPEEQLVLTVNEVDLNILNPLTGRDISGTLNAVFQLNDYHHNPQFQNEVYISALTVDKFLVGDVTGRNVWDADDRQFIVNFFIDRHGNRIVNLDGTYDRTRRAMPLDITARLENANLRIIEPFFDDIFSGIGGTITGDYRITGPLAAPVFEGEGKVSNGRITINYLQTTYRFTGSVGLSPNSIYFRNFELKDVFNNTGTLNATLSHQNFKSMRVNLDASFSNFQVLNTTQKDNDLFYGQGYGTGRLNISGPLGNLRFTSTARTDKNTRIYIPMGSTGDVEKAEFIHFVSFSDSTYQQSLADSESNRVDLKGITLDFNLDITPDALFEIIFDYQSGDIISGRGSGEIQLQLDTHGDFNMFGPFEFVSGLYNFTLYDIINKDFTIQSGSRITWYGDPYGATLDINASYDQLASFSPILSNPAWSSYPELRRKYPVKVLLELDGPMLSPEIEFDIIATDLPQSIVVAGTSIPMEFEFQAFKNRLDEQELKRQVFSLVVLRRFSPIGESLTTRGTDIVTSVSELLSNQLSNWISQVDENLEIDLDLSALDEEAYNTFQLRLSYTFMNGRLRVTRDGTFYGNNENSSINNSQNLSSIAGDWTVDYLLTADGKLKIKMYNRTNINPILNTLTSHNSVTTGVSLSHTQSFNRLADIWRSSRARREQEPDPDDDDNEAIRKEDEQNSGG